MLRRFLFLLAACLFSWPAAALDCREAVRQLQSTLSEKINQDELTQMIIALNGTSNQRLPEKFITKREAQAAGWRPGRPLWKIPELKGRSIGGDRFGNREGRLPRGEGREADLGYQGGKRGAQRLVFSADGRRHITVDHYQTFKEVPSCR